MYGTDYVSSPCIHQVTANLAVAENATCHTAEEHVLRHDVASRHNESVSIFSPFCFLQHMILSPSPSRIEHSSWKKLDAVAVGLGSAASASGDGGWSGGGYLDPEGGHWGNGRSLAASGKCGEASGRQSAPRDLRVCEPVLYKVSCNGCCPQESNQQKT